MKKSTVITKAEFCRRLKLSPGRGSQLVGKGLPVTPDGRVPFEKAKVWYEDRIRKGARKRGPGKKDVLAGNAPAAARLLEAQANKEEQLAALRKLDVRKRNGELLEREQVTKVWGRLLTAFRSRALLTIDRLATSLGLDPARREIVRKQIYEMLTDLSQTSFDEEGG